MSIEAMKQALEALDGVADWVNTRTREHPWDQWQRVEPAITALRTAIAEAEKQEPVDERTLIRKIDAELEAGGLESYTAVHNSRYRSLTTVRHFIKALRYADYLDAFAPTKIDAKIAAELRRLHAENEALKAQRQPLTDEALDMLLQRSPIQAGYRDLVELARAVEVAHGITGEQQ